MSEWILEMRNITKEFPGVKALNNVNLAIRKGEIHALCGENGAGKSTLMKVLSGVYPYRSYTGDIVMNGQVKAFHNVHDSELAGIAIIYQELALVKDITVAENIFLGKLINRRGIVDWNANYARARSTISEMGVEIDMSKLIRDIGVGQQQLVAIAKALVLNADILILDEPTAALAEHEVSLLMRILRKLRERGTTCILITHKLNEVFEIADRVTVLRDGATISTMDVRESSENLLIRHMVGREITQRYPLADRHPGGCVFEAKGINYFDAVGKQIVFDAGFSVRSGEVVGIGGLMGAGRTELISAVFGFHYGRVTGQIYVDGKPIAIRSPKNAIQAGMAMLSEDRKRFGLITDQPVSTNISVASLEKVSRGGILNTDNELSQSRRYSQEIGVKAPSIAVSVSTLSGGNQQKVLLARCLMTKPKVLFMDEPTRGIDVGAKYEIYVLMNKLAAEGTAIVIISSELPELISMTDRVYVMCRGRINGELAAEDITQEKVIERASGGNV